MGCEKPHSPATATALRAHWGPHAGWRGTGDRGFPGSKCGSVRIPTQPGASAAAGVAGQGAGACFRGSGVDRVAGGRDASEIGSQRVPRRRGRRGGETPPAGQATSCGDPGAARGAGERRAPCTSCSVHAAFHRPALGEPASGRAAPHCRLPGPGTRRGGGTQRARPPAGRARRAEPPPELLRAAEPEPNCRGVRVCASSSLLPSLAQKGDGPSSRLPAGSFCGRGLYLHTNCLPLARLSASAQAREACFPHYCLYFAPAFQITSGNLWEELRGWKMLLRFAKGRKLCHPAGDLCHA